MSGCHGRRWLAAGLLAAAVLLPGCGGGGNSDAARIERLRKQGNVAALAKEAENPDTQASCLAVRAIGFLGAPAQPHLNRALKDPRGEVREEAALAYPRAVKGTAAPELAQVAHADPSAGVRAAAVTALGHMRAMDEMETLMAALEDPDALVRQRASDAVFRIVGLQFNVDGTPDERRQNVEQLRKLWLREGQYLRKYHQKPQGPAGPKAGGEAAGP